MPAPKASATGTLIREFGCMVAPLTSINSADRVRALARDLGWELPSVPQALVDAVKATGTAATSAQTAVTTLQNAQSDSDYANAAIALLTAIRNVIQAIRALEAASQSAVASLSAFDGQATFASELPERLLDYLLVRYLEVEAEQVHATLMLLGIIEVQDLPATAPKFHVRKINWDRIPKVFSDPAGLAADAYKWTSGFDAALFLDRVTGLMRAFVLPGGMYLQPDAVRTGLGRTSTDAQELRLPLWASGRWPTYAEAGITLSAVETGSGNGLALMPYLTGAATIDAKPGDTWSFTFTTSATLDGGIGVILQPPPANISFKTDLLKPMTTSSDVLLEAKLARQTADGQETYLIGSPGSSSLTLRGIGCHVIAEKSASTQEIAVELTVDKLNLVITAPGGDGFIAKLLPSDGIQASTDFAVGWSSSKGLYFRGAGALEITIPVHVTIGPLTIDSLYLQIAAEADLIAISLAGSFGTEIGPVTASIDRIGLIQRLKFGGTAGNLGPIDLQWPPAFRPPNGVGVAIDTGAVVGGGYLFFDPDKKEYAGILQLEIADTVSVKAIGLITTVMPDGSTDTYSLLIIISAEFPPIQIGFGFTLTGIGGLLGVNRQANIDALKEGVKNQTLGSIMFPVDPVANAQRIISDLRAVFPPVEGRHVLGPMGQFGWGTPTLMTMELGIIIELPDPVRIVILGIVKAKLPEEQVDIVRLQMNVLGVIDFALKEADCLATLYDSKISQYPVSGAMAMRSSWGAHPDFVLSVGGFNPRFPPPANFDVPDRMSIAICDESHIQISANAYFAITANTVQFGAGADLYAHKSFSVIGTLSAYAYAYLDALVQFKPSFHVAFDVGAGATIKRNGHTILHADITGTLEGPGPWHVKGKVRVHFMGTHKISFDATFGDRDPPPPVATQEPLALLVAALQDHHSWSAYLAPDEHGLVTFRKVTVGEEVMVHPLGVIGFRQNLLPLDILLDKVQGGYLSQRLKFAVDVSSFDVGPGESVHGYFAAGEFLQMDDASELSRPAFELMPCGYSYPSPGGLPVKRGDALACDYDYNTVVIDELASKRRRDSQVYRVASVALPRLIQRGAAAHAPLRKTGFAKFARRDSLDTGVKVDEPRYVVANIGSLKPHPELQTAPQAPLTTFASYAEARGWYLKHALARDQWRVVAAHETVPV